MAKLTDYAQSVARVLLALIFVIAGAAKINNFEGTQGYMESAGVPGILLPLVIALELLGGLAIIVGYRTRLVALALAGFCIASGVLFHFDPADQAQMTSLMKNVAIAGGFLLLFVHGPGPLAVDKHR